MGFRFGGGRGGATAAFFVLGWLAFVFAFALVFVGGTRAVEEGTSSSSSSSHRLGRELVDWLRSEPGAFFHPSLVVQVPDDNNDEIEDNEVDDEESSAFNVGNGGHTFAHRPKKRGKHHRHGIVTTLPIARGRLLMEIPASLLMRPGPPRVGERVVGYFTLENEREDATAATDDDDDDAAAGDSSNDDDNAASAVMVKRVVPFPGTITSVSVSEDDGTTTLYGMMCDRDEKNVTYNMTIDMIAHEGDPINCATVRMLAAEMRAVEAGQSTTKWGPYVRYLNSLLHQVPPERPLPSSWSPAGREWLGEVLGHYLEDYGGEAFLPPPMAFGWAESDGQGRCGGEADPVEHDAYLLVRQRSYEEVMAPVYDILSHHNGQLLNTVSTSVSLAASASTTSGSIQVHASRDIQAGEELYTSYNFCTDCADTRNEGYGTPELLRDYGFVEDYPRRFVFHDHGVSFDIDYVHDEHGRPTTTLAVNWTCPDCRPDEASLHFLETQLQRLQDLAETDFPSSTTPPSNVPFHEWHVICEYLDALIAAMRHAIQQAKADNAALAAGTRCTNDHGDLCTIASDRYPTLEESESWSEARPYNCDARTLFHYDEWVNIMSWTTASGRRLAVDMNPTMENDVCYSVDSHVQMCSSYRPHYHDMMVHYPAQFVPDIRHVLVVGGGVRAPMLLHEVLKYPALQRVVLLDDDPTSVLESYRYFGAQPHFDHPNVEWWFGDIRRSLSSLFASPTNVGSFDFVLLDVSDADPSSTWFGGTSNDGLEALSMLMTPTDSVLVQNEMLHFGAQKNVFREALHVHVYGIPVLCSKSFSLASNGVDFLRGPTHRHDVANPFRDGSPDTRYSVMRDYQRNVTNPSVCERLRLSPSTFSLLPTRTGPSTETEHARIPGALMLVDATSAAVSPEAALELIIRTVKSSGLSVLSTLASSVDDDVYSVFVISEQGYVAARFWSAPQKYLALDLHLWSDLDTQDNVRNALLKALGSNGYDQPGHMTSSCRIAACAFGSVPEAQQRNLDQRQTAALKSMCGTTATKERVRRKARTAASADSLVLNRLVENLELIKESNVFVAVICGPTNEECKSASHIARSHLVERVLPLYTCQGISGGVEFAQDGPDRLFRCEKETLELLRASLGDSKIRAIVLDDSASYSIAQVVVRIFMNHLHQQTMLTGDMFVQASVSSRDSWRKAFVDKFREDIFDDEPVFGTVITYNVTGTSTSFDIALMTSGNEHFPAELALYVGREKQDSGLVISRDTCLLRSGSFLWVEEFEPNDIFSHFQVDKADALRQWSSQLPLGLHSVQQVELDHSKGATTVSFLEKNFHNAFRLIGLHPNRFKSQPIGDGCLLVGLWSTGSSVLIWDGHARVDVSFFEVSVAGEQSGDGEDGSSIADAFFDNLLLQEAIRADRAAYPRGRNRAIVHPKPNANELPLWS